MDIVTLAAARKYTDTKAVGLVPKGDYNADTEYQYGDWVSANGGSYAYINPTPSTGVPLTDTSHWQQIAQKGDTGPSAYDAAVEAGYQGAEEQFNTAMGDLPGATQAALEAAEIALATVDVEDWDRVKYFVRLGKGPQVFPVGSALTLVGTSWGDLVLDVLGHSHHKKPGYPDAPTMTVGFRECVISAHQFSAAGMTWANTTGAELPAGTYNFTLLRADNAGQTREDGTYQFTTTQPIPAGGGWRHNKVGEYYSASEQYVPTNILGTRVTTYGANMVAIESGLTVTSGGGGTALGTASRNYVDTTNLIGQFNSTQRSFNGSNNDGESAMRLYLESAAPAGSVFTRQTIFDLPPTWAASMPGFLAGLPADFVNILGEVDIPCRRNNIFEIGGDLNTAYTRRSKMFLLSRSEVFGGNESGVADGTQLEFFKDNLSIDRIKFNLSGTARYWWLRSPYPSHASHVRDVSPDGSLLGHTALHAYGVAPACVIY